MAEPRELEAAEGLLALAGFGALAPAAGVAYEVGCSSVTRAMDLDVSLLRMLAGSKCLRLCFFLQSSWACATASRVSALAAGLVAKYLRHVSTILGLYECVWECCRWLQAPQQLKASWLALPDSTHCCLHLQGENWLAALWAGWRKACSWEPRCCCCLRFAPQVSIRAHGSHAVVNSMMPCPAGHPPDCGRAARA